MNKGLIALLIAFISIAGYYTLHSIPFTIENELYNKTEESDAKQRWIENMLMDPITGKIPIGYHLKELNFLRNFQQESNHYNFKKTRSATWNARGPWNVGGRTRAIAVDVLDSKHVIIGSVSGGIWQTTDAGASWQKVSLPQAHPGCVSITQDTRPGKTNLSALKTSRTCIRAWVLASKRKNSSLRGSLPSWVKVRNSSPCKLAVSVLSSRLSW